LQRDPFSGADGTYAVRSLYFDDIQDSALYEKLTGLDRRKKMRLRVYNHDDATIKLEKKTRVGNRTGKETTLLDRAVLTEILGGVPRLGDSPNGLLTELCLDMRTRLSRPVAMVDYRREAFFLPLHDVRVSCDRDLRLCLGSTDLFDPSLSRLPVLPGSMAILEIKYSRYVPDHVSGILRAAATQRMAYSKYAVCRQAGYHYFRRKQVGVRQ